MFYCSYHSKQAVVETDERLLEVGTDMEPRKELEKLHPIQIL